MRRAGLQILKPGHPVWPLRWPNSPTPPIPPLSASARSARHRRPAPSRPLPAFDACSSSSSALFGLQPDMPRQVKCTSRALTHFRINPHLPGRLPGEAIHHRQTQSRSLSHRLRRVKRLEGAGDTSAVMPVPVSLTQIAIYWPGSMSCCRAERSSSHLLAVSMVMRPPSGIASRALMQRLSSAFSSCRIDQRRPKTDGDHDLDLRRAGPSVRRTMSSMPPISRFALSAFGSSVWRRAKASSRCVSAAARDAASCAAAM